MKSSFSIIRFSNNDFQRKGNCATQGSEVIANKGFYRVRWPGC